MNLDFLLPIWNPYIVQPLMIGLRAIAQPLESIVGPGTAGGIAIILFTIAIRLVLLPLSLTQVKSQRAMLAMQPEMKDLQRKFKSDREGLARAQMALYKERGYNPMSGCLPLLIQMPILFGMYSAMSQLSTQGLTLDHVVASNVAAGRVTYQANRNEAPFPTNQWVLATVQVTPKTDGPFELTLPETDARLMHIGQSVLQTGKTATQGLTLTTGQSTNNPNPPSADTGSAVVFLRPAGRFDDLTKTFNRSLAPRVGEPFLVEIEVNANSVRVDDAAVVVTFDPAVASVDAVNTAPLTDVAFKSNFLWLSSLGEPDILGHIGTFGIPGLLLLLMTASSYVSQRMTTQPTEDPQQQAMMRSMAFMPLMYLFFFLSTPAGLVLYWFTSNLATMVQQYFTVGIGLLAADLKRVTGRNLQPSWAYAGASGAALARLTEDDSEQAETPGSGGSRRSRTTGNGSASKYITPAGGFHTGASGRGTRPLPGKGRKRGKR